MKVKLLTDGGYVTTKDAVGLVVEATSYPNGEGAVGYYGVTVGVLRALGLPVESWEPEEDSWAFVFYPFEVEVIEA